VFKPLMTLLIRVAGPAIIVAAIASEYIQASQWESMLSTLGFGSPSSARPEFIILAVLASWCASLISSVVVVIYFLEYQRLKRVPAVEEVRDALRGVWLRATASWLSYWALSAVAFLFLFIPGIYLYVAMCLVLPAQFEESLSVGDALKRSMVLVKSTWWWSFAYLLLIFLCAAIVSVIVELPGSAIYLVDVLTKDTGSAFTSQALQIVGSVVRVVSQIATTCVAALAATAYVVLYFRLVERAEGKGLLARVGAISGTEGASLTSRGTERAGLTTEPM